MSDNELVEQLYGALNSVLPLFILDHGVDYVCVDKGLAAMRAALDAGYNLPTRVSLYELITGEQECPTE